MTACSAPVQQPELLLGKVWHARLRPVRRAFSYPVYQLRLPLRSLARQPLSCVVLSRNRWNLLSFFDRDHGDGVSPLLDWVTRLLQAHGVDDADGEIWLHTFPRVLGYVFNPVSFWFCERADGTLRAIVCEVNNTFGERHCYLLGGDSTGCVAWGRVEHARKVFHVSPFCKVEGEYRFRFVRTGGMDLPGPELPGGAVPAPAPRRYMARIDYHDCSGPLLLTSLSTVAVPLTARAVLSAFFRMPVMTWGVIARIHWQAFLLLMRRVPWIARPDASPNKVSQ
ncbi:DUF1365 domain-containing protein [Imbroritus primus]|uniref:DUF1365 domain-containing protein n=1 Tax=Imbroritus primus TaxID=3058603 RepID=UPI003D161DC0